MLREVTATGYRPHELKRRWFRSDCADLYVWADEINGITAFEYCYRDLYKEHQLHWDNAANFRYARIDDGESSPLKNHTPLVVPNGENDPASAARHFREQGLTIDGDVYRFVLDTLYAQVPDYYPADNNDNN